jgi:hypothetical protein
MKCNAAPGTGHIATQRRSRTTMIRSACLDSPARIRNTTVKGPVSVMLCSALAGKQPDEVTHLAKPASENFLLPDPTHLLGPHAASLLTEGNGFAWTLRPGCGPRQGGGQTLTLKTPDRQLRSPFFYAKSKNLIFLCHSTWSARGWVHLWENSRPRTGPTFTQGFFCVG